MIQKNDTCPFHENSLWAHIKGLYTDAHRKFQITNGQNIFTGENTCSIIKPKFLLIQHNFKCNVWLIIYAAIMHNDNNNDKNNSNNNNNDNNNIIINNQRKCTKIDFKSTREPIAHGQF